MDHLAIGGDRDRVHGGRHHSLDISPGDVSAAASQLDMASGIEGGDVLSGDAHPGRLQFHTGHSLRLGDGLADRLGGLRDVYDDSALESGAGHRGRPQQSHAGSAASDHSGHLGGADVQSEQGFGPRQLLVSLPHSAHREAVALPVRRVSRRAVTSSARTRPRLVKMRMPRATTTAR